jgi:hypothetical protein
MSTGRNDGRPQGAQRVLVKAEHRPYLLLSPAASVTLVTG